MIILKNVLSISSHVSYDEFYKQHPLKDYDTLIVTWAAKHNFQRNGSYHDTYFNENSKDLPKSYWLLISIDGYVPSNLDDNNNICDFFMNG